MHCSRTQRIDACEARTLGPSVSSLIFFSKTDNLSKIAFYKLYLEVEVLGLDNYFQLSERIEFLEDDYFS